MTSLASFAIRRTAASQMNLQMRNPFTQQARCLVAGTGTSVPVDVDHYASGWDENNSKAMGDLTPSGKYQIQTFNKISPKVNTSTN